MSCQKWSDNDDLIVDFNHEKKLPCQFNYLQGAGMPDHVFVIMPFGMKDGIDFNKVYDDYIKPALEQQGYEVFRADKALEAGEIREEMFQELLLADLVVADLSIDNPNVWYELGVRHALRSRGIVLIQSQRDKQPFDVYTDRKLRYRIKGDAPDPEFLQRDRESLGEMANNTIASWQGKKISPVYQLLPNLQEPDWKSLRVGGVCEYWELYDQWECRLELARTEGRIGDMLLLADEAPVSFFRADAWFRAGKALLKACRYDFALEQLDNALKIDPDNLAGLQDKGICLQRLAIEKKPNFSIDRAQKHYQSILSQERFSKDPETWALLGRVDKDAWIEAWYRSGMSAAEMRHAAAGENAWLREAIESYAKAYRLDPAHYYSGINALTLICLYRHLTGQMQYDREIEIMPGALRYAAECERNSDNFYWARATIGDLEVLTGSAEKVREYYNAAIVKNDKKKFDPDSTLRQLKLLRNLGFHPERVDTGIEVLERALTRLGKSDERREPEKVFLFSGHMIDKPDRREPRFPAEKEASAANRIAEALEALGAGPDDLALTQGACGGDILFTEACVKRGVKVHWMQPFPEPEFIQDSVVCHYEPWRARYFAVKERGEIPIRTAPDALGEPPRGSRPGYPYERCNLWLLYTALAYGIDKVRFLCLWNGAGGDGPGGVAHMFNEVNRRTGKVCWIDSRTL